ncbi:unnamed protein product [Staurois parvus]|uniref:Uncharacterized protein n=1 Tax=Staurois parvus TaxID=386267 RepID=A0ABN9HUB3_9NEOB|nr:unnamed protein product [Staurois parvus]
MVRDGVTFLCGIPGIQRTGTSLWWVPGIRWLHHILVSSENSSITPYSSSSSLYSSLTSILSSPRIPL